MRILDALFLCFDKISEGFGLVKIETVFETYLAAAGESIALRVFACGPGSSQFAARGNLEFYFCRAWTSRVQPDLGRGRREGDGSSLRRRMASGKALCQRCPPVSDASSSHQTTAALFGKQALGSSRLLRRLSSAMLAFSPTTFDLPLPQNCRGHGRGHSASGAGVCVAVANAAIPRGRPSDSPVSRRRRRAEQFGCGCASFFRWFVHRQRRRLFLHREHRRRWGAGVFGDGDGSRPLQRRPLLARRVSSCRRFFRGWKGGGSGKRRRFVAAGDWCRQTLAVAGRGGTACSASARQDRPSLRHRHKVRLADGTRAKTEEIDSQATAAAARLRESACCDPRGSTLSFLFLQRSGGLSEAAVRVVWRHCQHGLEDEKHRYGACKCRGAAAGHSPSGGEVYRHCASLLGVSLCFQA